MITYRVSVAGRDVESVDLSTQGRAVVQPDGSLVFVEGAGSSRSVIAAFAPGVWRRMWKVE